MSNKTSSIMDFLIVKNQKVNYIVTILLWILSIILWAIPSLCIPWLLVVLVAMHFTELLFCGITIGKDGGEPLWKCIVMCMLFGFFWWLPIKMKLKKEMNVDVADDSAIMEEEK